MRFALLLLVGCTSTSSMRLEMVRLPKQLIVTTQADNRIEVSIEPGAAEEFRVGSALYVGTEAEFTLGGETHYSMFAGPEFKLATHFPAGKGKLKATYRMFETEIPPAAAWQPRPGKKYRILWHGSLEKDMQ